MKKLIGMLVVALLAAHGANAETAGATPAKKVAKKAPAHKKAAKTVEPKPGQLVDEDGKEFVAGGDAVTELNCELGNKLTLYRNATDTEHMALRWQQRVHRMTRVSTSTGANRFENSRYGLVWIGIPAKGMLLDSKRGQQLANECKDAEQMLPKPVVLPAAAAATVAPVAPTAPITPVAPMSTESPAALPAAVAPATPAVPVEPAKPAGLPAPAEAPRAAAGKTSS